MSVDNRHAGSPYANDDPAMIGPYTVHRRLGSGGEGNTYAATADHTGPVALKLHADPAATGLSEYTLGRRVPGAYTALPIDHGRCPIGAYLVTTLLAAHRPIRPALDIATLWQLAGRTAQILAAVHACGIIHCDVKPANILCNRTDVRIIDFGISRDAQRQPVGATIVRCSRGWAAPEQLASAPLSTAADVFAWGCLAVYLATGRSPYASATQQEWVMRVRMTRPDLYGLPGRLATLVAAALQADPRRRPPAAEIAAECRAAVTQHPPTGDRPRGDETARAAQADVPTQPGPQRPDRQPVRQSDS